MTDRAIYGAGAAATLLAVAALLAPPSERFLSPGPANSGHQDLTCAECHTPAPGTVRQQMQANARHAVGLRETGADLVHAPVSNRDCLACHRNDEDHHPPYRFLEPRFAAARAAIAPERCASCHREHAGGRVTLADAAFCVHCHAGMVVKNDPIEPAHEALAREGRFATCLRCHDYHGNHVRETPRRLDATAAAEADVLRYFEGAAGPYGSARRFPARTARPSAGGPP